MDKKFSQLHLIEHPVAQDLLTRLRDTKTSNADFAMLLRRLSLFLAQAVSAELKTKKMTIETPLETMEGIVLDEEISIVPVLRAGLGLLEGFQVLFPQASVGFLGLARNEETLKPLCYLNRLPILTNKTVFMIDPMLATGGSASHALQCVKEAGAKKIFLVTILAAPEGVQRIEKEHSDVPVYTIALDRCLNEKGYIMPGLGDAGDRLHGTC